MNKNYIKHKKIFLFLFQKHVQREKKEKKEKTIKLCDKINKIKRHWKFMLKKKIQIL